MFRAPDSDMQVEQTERLIAILLKISDDEKEEEEDEKLSLPSHRQGKASPQRARRAGR